MLLAVDTSTAQIGIALYDGTSVPGEFVWHSGLHHTEELAPALEELLRRLGIKMNSVSALGVALGPGSFTSLRVGLSFVKGLALSRRMPVIGIPTLDVVAAAIPPSDHRLAAIVQAGRGRLALGWYKAKEDGWHSDGPAVVTTATELEEKIHKPVIICGEMSPDDRQRLARRFRNVHLASPVQCVRRPAILAEMAWRKWQSGKVDPPQSLSPIYLHIAGGVPA